MTASEKIRTAIGSLEGIEVLPHRFGGIEFKLGKREIGHLHGNSLADIPFPKKVKEELVNEGIALPHHILPESGWISFYIKNENDINTAIDLFKRSYEIARKAKVNYKQ
ncbi:MAG: hypothetical protein EHM58_19675 [Ignavibacteriae bacterium]|nr:MAG: hypothetical protein EHM58_19675 [Ignavibacteriota bacterium]